MSYLVKIIQEESCFLNIGRKTDPQANLGSRNLELVADP